MMLGASSNAFTPRDQEKNFNFLKLVGALSSQLVILFNVFNDPGMGSALYFFYRYLFRAVRPRFMCDVY